MARNFIPLTWSQSLACEDTFPAVENLLWDVAHRFRRKYGGDVQEYFAEACKAYVEVFGDKVNGRHKEGVKFSAAVGRWAWLHLTDIRRLDARKRRLNLVATASLDAPRDDGRKWEPEDRPANNPGGKVYELLASLRGDAGVCLQLVLQAPEDLLEVVEAKGGEHRNFRSSLKDYLRDAGWAASRIAKAFADVKAALASL